MKLHKAIKKANDEKDIESLMPLYHEDFEFVRHQSGTSLNKSEYRVMIYYNSASNTSSTVMSRCIYENDDIIVDHSVTRFPDSSRESIIRVRMIEDGKIIRMETGATMMK